MREKLPVWLYLAAFLGALWAWGQDSEMVTLPITVQTRVIGETTIYTPDGGCTCTPISRVNIPSYPCNGTCGVSRARTRAAMADAVDGGALSQ